MSIEISKYVGVTSGVGGAPGGGGGSVTPVTTDETLSVPILLSGSTVRAPVITLPAQTVTVALLASTALVRSPVVSGGAVPIVLTEPEKNFPFPALVGSNYSYLLPAYTGGTAPVTLSRRDGSVSGGSVNSSTRVFSLTAAELGAAGRIKLGSFDYTGSLTGELATVPNRSTIVSATNYTPNYAASFSFGVDSGTAAALTAFREANTSNPIAVSTPDGFAGRVRLAVTGAGEISNVDGSSTLYYEGKPNKQRAELRFSRTYTNGEEFWDSWSFWSEGSVPPAPGAPDGNWEYLAQHHPTAVAGEVFSPPFALEKRTDGLYVQYRTSTQNPITTPPPATFLGPFPLQAGFNHVEVGIKMAQDGTAWLEVYTNGGLRVALTGKNIGYPGKTYTVKKGWYGGRAAGVDYLGWQDSLGVIFDELANVEMGAGVLRDRARNPKPVAGVSTGPILLEAGKSATGWSVTGGLSGTAQIDTDPAHSFDGGGLRLISNGNTSAFFARKVLGTLAPAELDLVVSWYYNATPRYADAAYMALLAGATLYAPDVASRKNLSLLPKGLYPHVQSVADLKQGTNPLPAGAQSVTLQEVIVPSASCAGEVVASTVFAKVKTQPINVAWSFDDNADTHRTKAAPDLAAMGWKASAFIIHNQLVGRNGYAQPQKLTVAQAQELRTVYDWDWCIGASDDLAYTAFSSMSLAIADIDVCWAAFTELGVPADHLGRLIGCYSGTSAPTGGAGTSINAYEISPLIYEVAAITSDGASPTVNFGASRTGLTNGMTLQIAGVPDGTVTIAAPVVSDTSVTLSAPIPAGTKRGGFDDRSGDFYRGKLQTALRNKGMKLMRTGAGLMGSGRNSLFTRQGFGAHDMLFPAGGTSGLTAAQILATVDAAYAKQEDVIFPAHGIGDSSYFAPIAPAVWDALLPQLKQREMAGQINVIRLSDMVRLNATKSYPLLAV